jgi:hypothetical protein
LRPAKAAIALGLGVLVVSTIGMLRQVEPFATWYYQFSWYSVLLAADGALALFGGSKKLKRGEFLLLGKPRFLLSMLGWSAVAWFFYELLNFRLQNWYYVFLPDSLAARWLGTTVAFATVLPAVFIAEAILSNIGFAHGIRTRRLPVTPRTITGMRIAGALLMTLVLAWPRYFFALVWGASMLMIEPNVYSRARDRSLLHDLELGKPGRLIRLLTGGALIGLLWESLNIGARAKWIYTVPFLENLKLFEMPVPDFSASAFRGRVLHHLAGAGYCGRCDSAFWADLPRQPSETCIGDLRRVRVLHHRFDRNGNLDVHIIEATHR